jgi:DNA-binding XRE family transcriptional regulator
MTPSEILLLRKIKSAEIKQSRIAANICKVRLAKESGLSRPTIDRIENGEEPWSVDSEILYVDAVNRLVAKKKCIIKAGNISQYLSLTT